MANPLQTMQKAANNVANTFLGVIRNPFGGGKRAIADKVDTIFSYKGINQLRRAAYEGDIVTLFHNKDTKPFVVYDNTVKKVIDKVSSLVFPIGTTFALDTEKEDTPLLEVIEENRIKEKTQIIVKESALMGYCAIRTIFDEAAQSWVTEVKKKEFVEPFYYGDKLISVDIYSVRVEGRETYWTKESWTNEEYLLWPEMPQVRPNERPDFSQKQPQILVNIYGEIPVTIVSHKKEIGLIGLGIINEPEISNQKSIISLCHRRHWAHINNMDPPKVRKNHSDPTSPLSIGNGDVIDISDGGSDKQCDLKLLEYSGVADSVQDEIYSLQCLIYGAAGLKPPTKDENPTVGTGNSGVALRVLHKEDLDTIEDLRAKSYVSVIQHIELILRIGARINKIKNVNADDPKTWQVAVSYPEFFPNTEADNQAALITLNMADLPPELKAPRVAKLLGITDEAEAKALMDYYIKREAMMEPNANIGG